MPDSAAPPAIRRRLRAMRLTLTATPPSVAAALTAAKAELAATLAAELATPTPGITSAALAALALGDAAAARSVIHLCRDHQLPTGAIHGTDTPGSAAPGVDLTDQYLLLLARYLAWTGELHLVRAEWPHALAALSTRPDRGSHPAAAGWARALRELALTAESIGDATTAAHLRAEPLALDGPTGTPREPDPELPPGPETPAPELVAYYLYWILGVEPDAPQNRLVLRPRLPEGWDELELTRLHFADADISLHYHRAGEFHHFTIEQESGAVPVRVIFEPEIPARRIASTVIDGEDAVLDPRPAGTRLRVPVQIVLDATRKIVLEGSSEQGRGRIALPVR